MTLLSDVRKRSVLSTDTAATVGVVKDFVIDAVSRQVVALKLRKTESGDYLDWRDLTLGPDVVTVASASVIGAARDRAADVVAGDHEVLGRPVLTDTGTLIGKVKDVDIDPQSGAITTIVTQHESIPGDRLLAAGRFAVVVHQDEPAGSGRPPAKRAAKKPARTKK